MSRPGSACRRSRRRSGGCSRWARLEGGVVGRWSPVIHSSNERLLSTP